ncbi:hypothetical protein J2Z21_000584 [Streptomyces griseochromogenes]|uniref:Ig-like domain-containing protein n=1 Tax=Streptomyces griseochromogenes TaxID=68214 RepID=A0A1B1B2M9_9ACTN|nr:hypothetical protein [Streptomyces griseochromogenes]ANP53001.1 hypothetical protein AVL59_28740 [Streptomyces griseochromogenes]MBP2047662.1 hypothetical protein [Streptomyces griseochromogenes]
MTTATKVAGRPLSGWSRDARHGTWYALLPGRSGEPSLGALRIDRALMAPEGTRERLAAAVLAVTGLRLPGVLGTVDLVAEAGEVWLITARAPAPTLADLLADGGAGLDAGSAASVLNETAQTLLALHKAGLAHGGLGMDTVVLAPDGVALLAEASLGTVLGDAPGPARREADVAAWADLSRTLGEAWAAPGSPAAALFAQCSAGAGSEGLASARAALVAGRAALPAGFLQRRELRAAVAVTTPQFTAEPTAEVRADEAADERTCEAAEERADEKADETVAPATAPDDQATVLGRRNRTPTWPATAEPTAVPTAAGTPAPAGADDGEILLRFGPGIPADVQDTLRAPWRSTPAPPDSRPRRRGRRAWIATTVFLTAVAVLLWLLLRPAPAPTVTAVAVQAPTGRLHCGQTADLVGVVTTDGRGGPVTYHWLRSDGHDSGELVHMARRGDRRVTVHLRWTVRGPGRFRGSARLLIAHQRKPAEAEANFGYDCRVHSTR